MDDDVLNWMKSKTVGGVTEIAVLAPIRPGRIPGERRTYEERLRFAMKSVQNRTDAGIPTELNRITTIHFGRMMIIRPDHYLVKSTANPSPDEFLEVGAKPNPDDASGYRSWLLTLVIFDGDLKVYFRDIAEFLGEYFDRIFENCEDFSSLSEFEEFWSWIKRYQISSDLFHSAYPNLTVPRIKYLEEFKRKFDLFVETVRTPTGRKVEDMNDMFDAFLRETQQQAQNFPAPGGVYITDKSKDGGQ